jgi:hypothetical protein
LWPQKEGINFGRIESGTSWWETKKIQIKLAMTYNKNEQHDAKNNAELQIIWMKMSWKMLEETIRLGWNRTSKAQLVMNDDDDDYSCNTWWHSLPVLFSAEQLNIIVSTWNSSTELHQNHKEMWKVWTVIHLHPSVREE